MIAERAGLAIPPAGIGREEGGREEGGARSGVGARGRSRFRPPSAGGHRRASPTRPARAKAASKGAPGRAPESRSEGRKRPESAEKDSGTPGSCPAGRRFLWPRRRFSGKK